MCRLYAQISSTARPAGDFLAETERSLLRQSNFRPGDFQQDGWGVGYYAGEQARVVKSAKAVFNEESRFRRLASSVRSRIVIGHLRAASNPMNLPKSKLMGTENSQPFTDGRFVFAHNGTVQIPQEVMKFLGPYRDRARGTNDSEIYFWQFRKFFDLYGDVPRALRACINELWTLWNFRKRPAAAKKKGPYLGLNTLISDGRSLHAMCHFPPRHPKLSLYNPRLQWGRMSFGRRDGRVVLASEELDSRSWDHFRNPEILSATLTDGRVEVKRQTFEPGTV